MKDPTTPRVTADDMLPFVRPSLHDAMTRRLRKALVVTATSVPATCLTAWYVASGTGNVWLTTIGCSLLAYSGYCLLTSAIVAAHAGQWLRAYRANPVTAFWLEADRLFSQPRTVTRQADQDSPGTP